MDPLRKSLRKLFWLFGFLGYLLDSPVWCRDFGHVGPSFVLEPNQIIQFYNSTGAVVPCSATGVPQPVVSWIRQDGTPVRDIPDLLHVRQDGSLVFPPFQAELFRQDLHTAHYRCTASNVMGIIGSREVRVRAVIRAKFDVRAYDDFVVKGNTAFLKCYIPTSVKDFVSVFSWETDDGYVIQKGANDGRAKITADGSLMIERADLLDGKKKYRCVCKDDMSNESVLSSTWGQLIVTEPTTLLIPRIRMGTREARYNVGESAELTCVAQGYPVPTYVWFKQEASRLSPLMSNRRLLLIRSTLLIHKARVQDSGTYICIANNTAGEDRAQIQLLIYEPLRVLVHPQRITVKEGVSVTFTCNVTGPATTSLTWARNLKPVTTSTRAKLISTEVLQIFAVQREDKGMYQCFAKGHDFSAQGSAQLSLEEDPPVFRELFTDHLLKPGSRTSLRCLVTGHPLPQVSWRLYSRPISEGSGLRIGDFVDAQGVLTSFINISSVNPEHGGIYSCHARNEIGAISHSAKLSVLGPPYVHVMDNITVVTGDDVTVDCAVSGHPLRGIRWKKESTLIAGGPRMTDHKNGTLNIVQATKDDQAWYHCEVSGNQGEKATGSVYIRVTERPMINPFQFSDDLVEGMRTMVLCNILAGEPPIRIVWLKDTEQLTHTSQKEGIHVTSLGEFASSLTIPSVTRYHAGNYTCLVTSGSAQASYTAVMAVRASPKWVKKPIDQEAVVGQRVIFTCQSEGIPEPIHRWKYRSGHGSPEEFKSVVSSSHMYVMENGSLVIKDVEKQDTGVYLCEANNGVGAPLSAVVHLTVNVPPRFNQTFVVKTVQEKQEVTLTCEPQGEAPLTVSWNRYQRPIDRSVLSRYVLREHVLPNGLKSQLTIPSVLRSDSGLFSCEAHNNYGREEKSIQLIVQGAPESPDGLQLLQVTSRQVTFSWNEPSSGNSPITGYIVVYNKSRKAQDDPLESVRVSAVETKVSIAALVPGMTYAFRVHAENTLGRSAPSQELVAATHEEAPSHAPDEVRAAAVSSTSVKVTWKSPTVAYSSDLQGYYVGSRDVTSSDPIVYKTVNFSLEDKMNEALLTNLKRNSKYAITVQAYNSKGAGPSSEETIVQTLEHDPPKSPDLRIHSRSALSMELDWTIPDHTPITGYILQYRGETGDWFQESHVAPQKSSVVVKNLRCGSKYHFILTAFNSAGRGDPSEEISASTTGGPAVAPDKTNLLLVNSTMSLLRLNSWQDNGCPISFFVVQYKPQLQNEWVLLSNNIVPDQSTVFISDLTPGTWYDLLMAAHNDAGTTEAEYVFSTLTSGGGTVPPLATSRSSSVMAFLRDPTVLVPIVCAVVVVVVITVVIVVVIVLRRKDSTSECRSQGAYSGSSGGKAENLSMSSYGKVKRADPSDDGQREPLYYPTPYATTQLSTYSESPNVSHCNTLRRHESKGHDYDVPHRHTQMGEYTSYASLWTRHHENPSANGDLPLMTITANDIHLKSIFESYIGVESETEDMFHCQLPDTNDTEEFSETECDRHHNWILVSDTHMGNGFDEDLLRRLPRVC